MMHEEENLPALQVSKRAGKPIEAVSVVRQTRAITFQLAEVAVTGPMVRAILAAIHRDAYDYGRGLK